MSDCNHDNLKCMDCMREMDDTQMKVSTPELHLEIKNQNKIIGKLKIKLELAIKLLSTVHEMTINKFETTHEKY